MKISDLNLAHLKYFLDTVKTGSVTSASDINAVTRPTISNGIKKLEEWAGLNLVSHKKGTFFLTKEGERFFRVAEKSFEQMSDQFRLGVFDSGSVRIGCSASLIKCFLLPALAKINQAQVFNIHVGTSLKLLQEVETGEINLAIGIGEVQALGVTSVVIHKGQFVLASKGRNFDATAVTESRPEVIELNKHPKKQRFSLGRLHRVKSWSVCREMAIQLNTACFIPDLLLEKPLKEIKLAGFKKSYEVFLAHRNIELLSESEAKLVTALKHP